MVSIVTLTGKKLCNSVLCQNTETIKGGFQRLRMENYKSNRQLSFLRFPSILSANYMLFFSKLLNISQFLRGTFEIHARYNTFVKIVCAICFHTFHTPLYIHIRNETHSFNFSISRLFNSAHSPIFTRATFKNLNEYIITGIGCSQR